MKCRQFKHLSNHINSICVCVWCVVANLQSFRGNSLFICISFPKSDRKQYGTYSISKCALLYLTQHHNFNILWNKNNKYHTYICIYFNTAAHTHTHSNPVCVSSINDSLMSFAHSNTYTVNMKTSCKYYHCLFHIYFSKNITSHSVSILFHFPHSLYVCVWHSYNKQYETIYIWIIILVANVKYRISILFVTKAFWWQSNQTVTTLCVRNDGNVWILGMVWCGWKIKQFLTLISAFAICVLYIVIYPCYECMKINDVALN